MFNTREKLMELMTGLPCHAKTCLDCELFNTEKCARRCMEIIADTLIANGVTIPVRCKDCENTCPGNNGLVCTIWGAGTEPDAFCSYGERRNDGNQT